MAENDNLIYASHNKSADVCAVHNIVLEMLNEKAQIRDGVMNRIVAAQDRLDKAINGDGNLDIGLSENMRNHNAKLAVMNDTLTAVDKKMGKGLYINGGILFVLGGGAAWVVSHVDIVIPILNLFIKH